MLWTYSLGVVEVEARQALDVVVPPVAEGVVGTDDDLCAVGVRNIISSASVPGVVLVLTFWLLPGSFTVVNCSSLYLWNAGPRLETTWGVARVLMSASSTVRFSRVERQ